MTRTTILGLLAGTIFALSGCERRETRMEGKETATEEPAAGERAAGEMPAAEEPMPEREAGEEVQPVAGREEWKEDLSDANILSYLVAANQHEVDIAQLVLGKTKNEDVKSFASLMVKDHSDAVKQTMDLSARINVKPESFAKLDEMTKQGAQSIDRLSKLSDADLDKAYLMTTIEDHRKLLTKIDTKLIQSADSQELKDLLQTLRGEVQSHLDQAGKIDLSKSQGGASTKTGAPK